jgi:hypothetical protein
MAAATTLTPTELTHGSNANFLVVFHAGGASACNHTTIAGGVAEAIDRPN